MRCGVFRHVMTPRHQFHVFGADQTRALPCRVSWYNITTKCSNRTATRASYCGTLSRIFRLVIALTRWETLLTYFQSRIQLLFIDLQQRPCHPLPETSRDDELQSRITANEHLQGSNDSEGPSKSTGRGWKCQDPDCFDKPKTLFTKRNNFVRHYSQRIVFLPSNLSSQC
jgi:hypothetical protein